MTVPAVPDFDTQRLYDSVELVSRVGERSHKQLCVMSLVALLAGERHSDRPDCACAVITAYAIKLNDALDDSVRQALKPFAPRFIGTRDGYEAERARFIVERILRDVVPRMTRERGGSIAASMKKLRLLRGEAPREGASRIGPLVRQAVRAGTLEHSPGGDLRYLLRAYGRDSHELVATAAAVMLSNRARLTAYPREARWYWNYATELLDKTCDIGISGVRSTAAVERMSQQAAAELQSKIMKSKFGMPGRRSLRSILRTPTE